MVWGTSNLSRGTRLKLVSEHSSWIFGPRLRCEPLKNAYHRIKLHGQEAYDAKFGKLEAIAGEGTWEPCHKYMLGHGIVGVDNLGGALDKVSGKRFRFFCFPIRRNKGDGAKVRCVAEIEESELNNVPERTYTYCGTGYGPACAR